MVTKKWFGVFVALAALALSGPAHAAGWYLIAPLVTDAPTYTVHIEYPYAYWENIVSFDSSEKCEAGLEVLQQRAQSPAWKNYWDHVVRSPHEQAEARKDGKFLMPYSAYRKRIGFAMCLASDDPRLAPVPTAPADTDPPPPLPPDSLPQVPNAQPNACPLGQSC